MVKVGVNYFGGNTDVVMAGIPEEEIAILLVDLGVSCDDGTGVWVFCGLVKTWDCGWRVAPLCIKIFCQSIRKRIA